jgi:hypothetical protein
LSPWSAVTPIKITKLNGLTMQKSDIKPRTEYAFREKRVPGSPLEHVRVLEHLSGNKWKVEWIDPNPGLVHYAESAQLVAIWKGRKAFLKEEDSRERLLQHNREQGYAENSPISNALYEIFESTWENEVSFYKGVLSGSPEPIDRLRARAGVEAGKNSIYAYVDREGKLHLPFDEALELAKKFCAAEPMPVLTGVETTEREWAQEARAPGNAREETIQKLERLVWDAIYALQKANLDNEAARLRRAITRR